MRVADLKGVWCRIWLKCHNFTLEYDKIYKYD